MLRVYVRDLTRVLDFTDLTIQDDISVKEHPTQILGRKEQVLRNNVIPLIKIL